MTRPCPITLLLLALLGMPRPCVATPPRMLSPTLSAGTLTLQIAGDTGVSYRLEASTNLVQWTPVGTGTATASPLSFQAPFQPTAPTVYYRGVQVGAAKPFTTIVPLADTNHVTQVFVTPERPATVRWVGSGGASVSVSFPTNAFPEATLVTLTVVPSAQAMPNQAGLLAGVRLGPEGLRPLAPFFVQFDFPTNIDAAHISSFGFDPSGANFHLVPDAVVSAPGTHRVRILADRLRGYGCGVFTLDELEAVAATVPPVTRSGAGLAATLEECFPSEAAEAKRWEIELTKAISGPQQAMAAKLGRERQRQLLGTADAETADTSLGAILVEEDAFFDAFVRPRLPAAMSSCLLANTLLPWVTGHDRHHQLLGDSNYPDSGLSALFCAMTRRCQEQAIECCRSKGGDIRLLEAALVAERRRQLLGGGTECGALDIGTLEKDCAPDWYGHLTLDRHAHKKVQYRNGTHVVDYSDDDDTIVRARVANVKVRISPAQHFDFGGITFDIPGSTNLTGELTGTVVSLRRIERVEQSFDDPCHGGPDHVRRELWTQSITNNAFRIDYEALLTPPSGGSSIVSPYLTLSGRDVTKKAHSEWKDDHATPGPKLEEPCVLSGVGGSTDESLDSALDVFLPLAREGEFEFTDSTIHYRLSEPYKTLTDAGDVEAAVGTRELTFEIHRIH